MDAPDFIPDSAITPSQEGAVPSAHQPDFIPDDQFTPSDEKYGSAGQQAIAGLEGLAKGIAGPVATAIETGGKDVQGPLRPLLKDVSGLGIKPEDIRGREEANPITSGLGELAGFGIGALTGTGEAAVMEAAGKGAAKALGLETGTSLAARVGSSAVKNAAEMAVMQSGDEVSKQILQDPDTSAQSAIANIGLATALGGAGGAFITGAISPLWKATLGPKTEEFLSTVKNHLNGGVKTELPSAVQKAVDELGIELHPATKAALSGDPKAIQLFNELREAQHPEILSQLKTLKEHTNQAVMDSLGVPVQDMAHFSNADAGHEVLESFNKEFKEKYKPAMEAMEARNKLAETIEIPKEMSRDFGGKLMEEGMQKLGADSPYFRAYEHYAERIANKDTIGGLDKLKTEIGNKAASLTTDLNEKHALKDIRNSITDFQNKMIDRGVEGEISPGIKQERMAQNAKYAEFRKLSDDFAEHLGINRISGYEGLKNKLGEISPEDLIKKFSPKGNVESIEFMQKHFPETFQKVQNNETKKFISPFISNEAGEISLKSDKLAAAIEKGMKGSPEYMKYVVPEQALSKIQAAKVLSDATPGIKSSGTAGWISKLTKHMPASAMSALGYMLGHNPLSAYAIGELVQRLGKDAPEAIKLSYLKWLSSDAPVKAEGMKSMVDYLHNVIKGESAINKAVDSIFKTGSSAASNISIPSHADLAHLDKLVAKNEDRPEGTMARLADGHTGHYMPEHQAKLTESTGRMVQYLQSIRPKPIPLGPLDKPVDPSPGQMARYNRALAIAENPLIVMQHIKDGTLQTTDIADLHAMYPQLYPKLSNKIMNGVIARQSDTEPIPYKVRTGMSLFMSQPMDNSMLPASIMAAQPVPKQPQQQPGQANTKHSTTNLGKMNNQYRTPDQASESRRLKHD